MRRLFIIITALKCLVTDVTYTYNVTVQDRLYKLGAGCYPISQEIKLPSSGYSLSRRNIGVTKRKFNRPVSRIIRVFW